MSKTYVAPIHNTRRPNIVRKEFRGKSRTQGSDQKEADIHYILRQAERGIVEFNLNHEGKYGDFSGSIDLQAANQIITAAATMWEEMPSAIRKIFDQDSGQFVDFMQDNNNFEAIAEMGLDNSHLTNPNPPEEEPPEVPPETPPAPAEEPPAT